MDGAIRVRVAQGGEQLPAERIRQRIALSGAIQSEPAHRGTRVVDQHQGFGNTVGHGRGAYREAAIDLHGNAMDPALTFRPSYRGKT